MTAPSSPSSSDTGTKKGQKFWLLGDVYTCHIIGAETENKYAMLEITSPPGSGPPFHCHSKETEGSMLLMDNSRFNMEMTSINKTAAKPGTSLHLKKDIPRTYKNLGNSTGRLLVTIVPAGFKNFFAEVGIPIDNEEDFFSSTYRWICFFCRE